MNKFRLLSIFLLMVSSQIFAGSFYSSPSIGGSLATSVTIENKGIYNLVISVQFLTEPFDKTPFTSNKYEEMIQRLNVEWRGEVLKTVLESSEYKVSDLSALKNKIDGNIAKLIAGAKKKHGVKSDVEVVYSIGSFYLVNLNKE